MKFEFKKSIADFEDVNQRVVDKEDFLFVFGRAFNRAFTVATVKAAFEATGVFPFNPRVIRPEQLKPAEATSVKGSFALTQTSPVRAIISSFRTYQATTTTLDASPTHALPPEPIASSSHLPLTHPSPVASSTQLAPTSPSCTSSRRFHDETDDPVDTPSKRMRILSSSLASTSSGSFLTSKNPYTSNTPFPRLLEKKPLNLAAPKWSLLEQSGGEEYRSHLSMEAENERLTGALKNAKSHLDAYKEREEIYAAQAVIQDLTLEKMNQALHAKEEKKRRKNAKADNEVLPNQGLGRLWTDTHVLEFQERKRDRLAEELAQKESRKAARVSKKTKKAALEDEWKEIQEEHAVACLNWNTTCEGLQSQGVIKKRDLPKKPTHITKKALTALCLKDFDTDNDMDGDGDGNDGDGND
ncbi:hypothetical protein BT96DRAFT_838124 [Gymnopus androsaceus JB14]|uniref:Uncharacterized protein n=1 Tax=Gymnopus androsaceus JB14 TaxID=1447944 RepID=A0A6A4GNU9_9AGAR|nr:hypothetical protein BT96DRAFT_838124 [Gymnopus androsaceus JB14]